MKKYSLLIGLVCLNPGLVFASIASKSQITSANPASQQWVLQQLQTLQQQMQNDIATAASANILSETSWLTLCPTGQSIDNPTGCTPNCQGAQSAACTQLLTVSEVETQTLLTSSAATGLSVFRVTLPTSSNRFGPTIINASNNNNIRCQTYTVRGTLLNNLNDNTKLTPGSTSSNFQQYTLGIDLGTNVSSGVIGQQTLTMAVNQGAQRLNQQYYVICMSYTVSGNIATNVNMDDTLTMNWT